MPHSDWSQVKLADSFLLTMLNQINFFRYGLVTETQVTQADVVSFESKWNLSVLRIRNNAKVAGAGTTTTHTQNEITLILNLICDQVSFLTKKTR